jgi:hypothetical protein
MIAIMLQTLDKSATGAEAGHHLRLSRSREAA